MSMKIDVSCGSFSDCLIIIIFSSNVFFLYLVPLAEQHAKNKINRKITFRCRRLLFILLLNAPIKVASASRIKKKTAHIKLLKTLVAIKNIAHTHTHATTKNDES